MSKGPLNEESNPSKELDIAKNVVPLNEAGKILNIIKRSDYKVVDQLHQKSSKIYILLSLLNSETHKEVLLKVLNQDHVD